MPVLVTGAETAVGRTVATQLARRGGEVRVFLDLERAGAADPAPFHALGCKVARGALDDEGHLESALEQVHTVMHLASSPLQDPERMLDAAATVLSAAIGAGCRRVIWLSQLGAEAPEGNDYLAACAEAEDLLTDAPLESVVFRPSLTYGPDDDLTAALAGSTANDGSRPGRHAPLYAGDLAEAVAAVDRERVMAGPADLHVIVPIAGPDLLRLADVIQGLRDNAPVVCRSQPLPGHVTDLLARDLLPPAGAIGAYGTSFSEGTRLLAAAWAS
ncbi:MAG: SDR family oxidoreductase [Egibacteraceae bacterium]